MYDAVIQWLCSLADTYEASSSWLIIIKKAQASQIKLIHTYHIIKFEGSVRALKLLIIVL